ncbi:IMPACT family member [Diplodia seriata]|uniref:IMPACT family member n=1 Tax=Diplodia seriata TaxID=420778 RepID=A0A1S8BMN9_9PEZI|nr:IMPACT family member [Diplodia seriata]
MSSFSSSSSSLKRRLPPPSSTTNDDDDDDAGRRRPSKTTKLLHNNASPSPSSATTTQHQHHHQQIYRSAPLTDRASTFTAAFSPTLPARTLQAHPDFAGATHRIAAWRRPTAQRKLFASSSASASSVGRVTETGFDDDGEQYAGKRLAKVLEAMGVGEGAVVVARWYGGVLLGPVRFAHVERVARHPSSAWSSTRKREGSNAVHAHDLFYAHGASAVACSADTQPVL